MSIASMRHAAEREKVAKAQPSSTPDKGEKVDTRSVQERMKSDPTIADMLAKGKPKT